MAERPTCGKVGAEPDIDVEGVSRGGEGSDELDDGVLAVAGATYDVIARLSRHS